MLPQIKTVYLNEYNVRQTLPQIDLLIDAVKWPPRSDEHIVTRELKKLSKCWHKEMLIENPIEAKCLLLKNAGLFLRSADRPNMARMVFDILVTGRAGFDVHNPCHPGIIIKSGR